jgi:protein-S-isoprenylcysteine O-methyltransferase Ste14
MALMIGMVTICLELLAFFCLLVSIFRPKSRIWPPPRPAAWQTVLMNFLFLASAAGLIVLGVLEWTPPNPNFLTIIRILLGGALWLAGFYLTCSAIAVLGIRATIGFEGEICRKGIYHQTRNPQYMGFFIMLAGWNLLIASAWVLAAAGMAAVVLWFLPWAEEPFLHQKYGGAFERYRRSTPRWFLYKEIPPESP